MAKKKSTWQSMLPLCFRASTRNCNSTRSAKSTLRRLSFSDVSSPEDLSLSLMGCDLCSFTLTELEMATKGFSELNFLGEGGFGPVYKGYVDERVRAGFEDRSVAVKLLDLDGAQGHREWLTEVIFLGQLQHPHLVKLIGYCYEKEHRLLVYEYMAKGSLENHLFKRFSSLPWSARLKIAVGAAKGLAFLHQTEQPVIYRDFKASNILLDSDYNAKLSDFGLAKDGPEGDDTHVSTRVMGTEGYAAPEYIMTGHLTAKSDVYSFGVVLLELLTGRRSVDKTKPPKEQNLVEWARPYLTEPERRISRIIDPSLDGKYSVKGAIKAATIAYQCLSQTAKSRPNMSNVVVELEPLQYMEHESVTYVYTLEEQVKENIMIKDKGNHKNLQGHKLHRRASKDLQCT